MKTKMLIAGTLLVAALTVAVPVSAATPFEPQWESLPVEMLDQYAALYRINLGDAQSRAAKIAVLRDAWEKAAPHDLATMTRMVTEPISAPAPGKTQVTASVSHTAPALGSGGVNLPPADLLRPRLPDLSQTTVPGRALNVILLILGAFGVSVIVFGTLHFLVLASQAFAGKLSRGALVEKFLTYVAAFAVTFFVLGGSMYAFLRAVIDFFVSNA